MTEDIIEFLRGKPGVTFGNVPMYGWNVLKVDESDDGVLDEQLVVLRRTWNRLPPEDLPLLVASPKKRILMVDHAFEIDCILRHAAKLWLESRP